MDDDLLQFGRRVIQAEAEAVARAGAAIGEAFAGAVARIVACRAAVLTTGVGKAGHIARKLSASFSSTGTPSHYLNPAEAMHGDVGSVREGDVVLILSYSGESDEVLRLLDVVKKLGNVVVCITRSAGSSLGRHGDFVLEMGRIDEACPLGLAPSATTTAMLALGDALVLTVMKQRQFTAADFAVFHPAGQLGRKLIKVREAMTFKLGENLPVTSDQLTVGQVLHQVSAIKRRSGAVILVDDAGRVSGFFTDGDLRRLITAANEQHAAGADGDVLRRPINQVMGRQPTTINGEALASEAMAIMKARRFDELPVVDDDNKPIGLIDVQDLVVLRILDSDEKP